MVKSYLRYEPAVSFGVIVSVGCNITYDGSGKHLLTGALEKLCVWNLRQGLCTKSLAPDSSGSSRVSSLAATSIASSVSSSSIACGYADGSIRMWDVDKGICDTTLNGHRKAVTILRYNQSGSLLASGSQDNNIILWDVVGEAGLFRLSGHRDQVTDLVFLGDGKMLVSSSKDKFLRVWDLETQHCLQIVSGHHSEIWSIDVDPSERYLVSGSADPELRVYTIKHDLSENRARPGVMESEVDNTSPVSNKWEFLRYYGEIQRKNKDRVGMLRFSRYGNLLACQVSGSTVEIFRVLDENESMQKAKRRISRKDKKSVKVKAELAEDEDVIEDRSTEPLVTVPDIFKSFQSIKVKKKISSICFCPTPSKGALATLALSLNNNLLEVYTIDRTSNSKSSVIDLQGHRSDIRSVTLSSDNSLLLSTSHNAIKIWNPSTGSCLRTIESGYGLCSMFVPGDKFAIVGTKSGMLEIIDIRSGTCLDVVPAHGDHVRSIAATSDGFVTVGSDLDVKFWEYQTATKKSSQLTVIPVRNLTMKSNAVVVAVSPDEKLIAVATLDNRVQVFFMDTLRSYIELVLGHEFVVLCMDISSDGDLIATGGSMKDLKIWGLDFGNIRKSFNAGASVMAVKFVRHTHYLFSVGKDNLVKYWDTDKFELLLTLEGHHSAIWCLSISNRGDFLVTGSHDRSIRRWDRTEEPFFIEEEKEKRLEEFLESNMEKAYAPKEELPDEGAVALTGNETKESVLAADSILEALDIAEEEMKRITEYEIEKSNGSGPEFRPNILMLGLSPSDYVLRAVSSVRTNDLELALLALPFLDSLRILSYLKNWVTLPDKVELVCRVATVLLRIHHNQLVSTVAARPVLSTLKDILHARVKDFKDTLGFNIAAMDHLKHMLATRSDAPFRDAKAKLLELHMRYSKQADSRTQVDEGRRKRKKQKKKDDGHIWS